MFQIQCDILQNSNEEMLFIHSYIFMKSKIVLSRGKINCSKGGCYGPGRYDVPEGTVYQHVCFTTEYDDCKWRNCEGERSKKGVKKRRVSRNEISERRKMFSSMVNN